VCTHHWQLVCHGEDITMLDQVLRVEAGITKGTSGGRYSTWARLKRPDDVVTVEATALFLPVPEELFGGFVPPYRLAQLEV
jgi:hypothetical protein